MSKFSVENRKVNFTQTNRRLVIRKFFQLVYEMLIWPFFFCSRRKEWQSEKVEEKRKILSLKSHFFSQNFLKFALFLLRAVANQRGDDSFSNTFPIERPQSLDVIKQVNKERRQPQEYRRSDAWSSCIITNSPLNIINSQQQQIIEEFRVFPSPAIRPDAKASKRRKELLVEDSSPRLVLVC